MPQTISSDCLLHEGFLRLSSSGFVKKFQTFKTSKTLFFISHALFTRSTRYLGMCTHTHSALYRSSTAIYLLRMHGSGCDAALYGKPQLPPRTPTSPRVIIMRPSIRYIRCHEDCPRRPKWRAVGAIPGDSAYAFFYYFLARSSPDHQSRPSASRNDRSTRPYRPHCTVRAGRNIRTAIG